MRSACDNPACGQYPKKHTLCNVWQTFVIQALITIAASATADVALHLSRLPRHTAQHLTAERQSRREKISAFLPHCLTDTEPDAGIVVNVSIEFISVLFMTSARRHCNPCCAQTSTAAVQASGRSLPQARLS